MTLYRHVDVSQSGDVTVVRLLDKEIRGEAASNDLEPELTRLVSSDGSRQVLLDLGNVEFVTSSAIVQLIMLNTALAGAGARLILCSLRPVVYDAFSMMKLDTLFQIEDDRAAGVDAFTRPPPPPPFDEYERSEEDASDEGTHEEGDPNEDVLASRSDDGMSDDDEAASPSSTRADAG
ncbi:MAG: STAS domain-containing protein [Pirellulales bacterium]